MAAASPIFWPVRSANQHENRANEQKNREYARDLDSCITVALPHVALEGSLRPPKTHPESDSFLSCATKKKKRGWRRRARDNAKLRSRLRSLLFVGWALGDAVHYSRLFRITLVCQLRLRFPIGRTQTHFFFEIKLKLIENKIYFYKTKFSVPR